MNADEVDFYVRHRRQISEWAALRGRVSELMRDAVTQGSLDSAVSLLEGSFGDAEVDFYVRNRALITGWNALQVPAGLVLHEALLGAAHEAGCQVTEGNKGWTSMRPLEPELVEFRAEHEAAFAIFWTKQDLLSTVRGYPFPRIALSLDPSRWEGDRRARVINATRPAAIELGMKKKDTWWPHWCMLDEISESEDLRTYAAGCVAKLRQVSERLYPPLRDAILAEADETGQELNTDGDAPETAAT